MTIYKEFRMGGGRGNPFGSFAPILFLVLLFIGIYFVAKGIFWILSWAAPVLFILSLIIDYTVTIDFLKFIGKTLKEQPVWGLIAILLIIVGYPIVSGYLFFRSLMRKQIKKAQTEREGAYIEYEVVEETEDVDFLELPQDTRQKEKLGNKNNEYDQLFD